jgi:hypothetical protein
MSYRGRLTLAIIALILVLVIGLTAAYLRYLVGVQLQIALRQAENVAEQLQSAALGILSDQAWPEQLERWLGGAQNIAEIVVTDQTGRVIAGTNPARDHWTDLPQLDELAGAGFLAQWRAVYAPLQDFEVTRAVAAGEEKILTIHVAVSTALLRRDLGPPVARLLLLAGFGLLGSLAVAILFSRIVFRPLDRLGEAIDRMTRGEFAAPPALVKPARDEYTAISSKLNILGQQFSSLRGNMEQLLQKLDGAVLLFDADDRLIIASAATERFLSLGRWQMMGQKLDDIFPEGTDLGALVSSAARLRQPVLDQLVDSGPGGAIRRVLVSVELIDDFVNRRRLGLLVTLRDADTRRQIETQVEVSSRLAAISRLTGGVAHEIKNPLNAISVHLDLLKSRLRRAGVETPSELEVIVREMTRLDRVVKTFLDFTRPVEVRLADIRLAPLMQEVVSLAGPEAQTRRVRVRLENGWPDAAIRADRDLLKQAVLNLAVNGIQAMPDGGELRLAVARFGSEVELEISDQGEGITPENREKIFRLYFTTKKNGSGMGLAMAFRVVQLHNGTIEFASEPGQGTTFRVRLPTVEAA